MEDWGFGSVTTAVFRALEGFLEKKIGEKGGYL